MASTTDMIKRVLTGILGGTLTIKTAESPTGRTYWSNTFSIGNSTADNVAVSAVAGKKHYVTAIQIAANGSSASSEVLIKSAATVLWRRAWSLATSALVPTEPVFYPGTLAGGTNEAINIALSVGNATATTFVNIQGYTE